MNILLKYHYRLGDIIRLFPIAKHYAQQGHEVFIECLPEYHDIFACVSYVMPVAPNPAALGSAFLIFTPQIWPERYNDFRQSGKTWLDYVYGLYPEWAVIERTIDLDRLKDMPSVAHEYNLPEKYCLLFPFSMSSQPVSLPCLRKEASRHMPITETYWFMAEEQRAQLNAPAPRFVEEWTRSVKRLSHLPVLIRDAQEVLTVNTSTTIIASAVRQHYFHVLEPNLQDNWTSPNQTVLTL